MRSPFFIARLCVLALALVLSCQPIARAAPGASAPIIITRGGVYSGTWESSDPDVPAVTIKTSEPVTIENSIIRGKGHLIAGFGLNLTVRNTRGYGLNPAVAGRSPGRFLNGEEVVNIVVENNYFESTSGIYIRAFKGKRDGSQSITIRHNRVRNIDGRKSDGNGGFSDTAFNWAQFVQFNDVKTIQGAEIAWNEVINEPYKSRVEDNINMFVSSGTADSPIRIHDNYIQGAYTGRPTEDSYSGGGILLGDGSAETVAAAGGFVEAYHNQIVSTTNYGIAIAAGHDNLAYENRVVSSGFLPNGDYIKAQNVGLYVWDISGDAKHTPPTFFNNVIRDSESGWIRKNANGQLVRDGNWWFPDCAKANDVSLCSGNTALPNPITRETEQAEFALWQAKVAAAGVSIGTRTSLFMPLLQR